MRRNYNDDLNDALLDLNFSIYVLRGDVPERWYREMVTGGARFIRLDPATLNWTLQLGKRIDAQPIAVGQGLESLQLFFAEADDEIMSKQSPYNQAAHEWFVSNGFEYTHCEAEWEDIGSPGSGPQLDGHDGYDEYTVDVPEGECVMHEYQYAVIITKEGNAYQQWYR